MSRRQPKHSKMGRKRGLPARAREKLVAEEAASAMEVERKEAVLQGKPDDSLFVLDSAGAFLCMERQKESGGRFAPAAGSHVHHIHCWYFMYTHKAGSGLGSGRVPVLSASRLCSR